MSRKRSKHLSPAATPLRLVVEAHADERTGQMVEMFRSISGLFAKAGCGLWPLSLFLRMALTSGRSGPVAMETVQA